jgi:hypothetical protein
LDFSLLSQPLQKNHPRDSIEVTSGVVNFFPFVNLSRHPVERFIRVILGGSAAPMLKMLQQFQPHHLILLTGALAVRVEAQEEFIERLLGQRPRFLLGRRIAHLVSLIFSQPDPALPPSFINLLSRERDPRPGAAQGQWPDALFSLQVTSHLFYQCSSLLSRKALHGFEGSLKLILMGCHG